MRNKDIYYLQTDNGIYLSLRLILAHVSQGYGVGILSLKPQISQTSQDSDMINQMFILFCSH